MIRRINKLAENRIPFLLIVDFEMRMPVLFPLDELPPDIRFSTPSIDFPDGIPGSREKSSFATSDEAVASPMRFEFAAEPIPYTRYLSAFNLVREYALMGRTYLTNLTFPTRIRTRLSLGEIYTMSRAKYKLLYGDRFVVFSPEIFVQIRDGQIRSFPMKGTIDADIPGARELVLDDRKEMAEHVTIVDLIRNDLSIHASRVRVEKFRYIDTLVTSHKKLLQVSSVIAGQLPDNYLSSLGEIIFSMLPAGSVSGAPKAETLRIIREAEGSDRGYYTGIMGFFNGKDFDSAVMIRYIENRSGQLFYRSGGGITFLSDPEKEYRELIDKVYMPIA
jgi:para-aminobenzoate synthetase component 1